MFYGTETTSIIKSKVNATILYAFQTLTCLFVRFQGGRNSFVMKMLAVRANYIILAYQVQ
jgi:hypothetical protein